MLPSVHAYREVNPSRNSSENSHLITNILPIYVEVNVREKSKNLSKK